MLLYAVLSAVKFNFWIIEILSKDEWSVCNSHWLVMKMSVFAQCCTLTVVMIIAPIIVLTIVCTCLQESHYLLDLEFVYIRLCKQVLAMMD